MLAETRGQKIVELDINEITLLSREEYHQYKDDIDDIGLWWWLCTPSSEDGKVLIVLHDELGDAKACVNCGGVRPVLRISNLGSNGLTIGSRFYLAHEQWCVISPDLALASRCLTFMPFRCDNGTNYEGSDVEEYLQRWAMENELDINEAGSRVDLKEVYDTLVEILTS